MKINWNNKSYKQLIFVLIILAASCKMLFNLAFAADNWGALIFPGGISRIDATLIAFPEFNIPDLKSLGNHDKLVLSAWPYRPGHYIAAMLDSENTESMTLTVAILQRVGDTVKQMVINKLKLEELISPNSIQLDLAPYRIRDDEFAFGVRLSTTYYGGASSSWTTLHLFRLAENKITKILEIEANNRSNTRGENTEIFSKSIVQMSPITENDFYDLIIKTTKGEELTESGKVIQQKKSSKTFYWNGVKYEAKKH